MFDRVTPPLNVAFTGPTFCVTVASNPSSGVPVTSCAPGTHSFSTSGLSSAAQTVARSALISRVSLIFIGLVPLPVPAPDVTPDARDRQGRHKSGIRVLGMSPAPRHNARRQGKTGQGDADRA